MKHILILCLFLISFGSQVSASTFAIEGCPVTLKIVDIRHPIILGQGFTGESDNPDLILKPIKIDTAATECKDYLEATRFEMNAINHQLPEELSPLKKGDYIEGGLMPRAPNPHGKFLMDQYLHQLRIHHTVENNLITPNKRTTTFKYFNNIGVFKDER